MELKSASSIAPDTVDHHTYWYGCESYVIYPSGKILKHLGTWVNDVKSTRLWAAITAAAIRDGLITPTVILTERD